jgi:hypothetical protein
MAIRLGFFVLFVLLTRYVVDGVIRAPFSGDSQSTVLIFSYFYMAGPELLFFTGTGLVLPLVFKSYSTLQATLICAAMFITFQLIFFFSFLSYEIFHWYGYFFLTAPFVGTLIGLLFGAGVSELVLRLTRRKLSPS